LADLLGATRLQRSIPLCELCRLFFDLTALLLNFIEHTQVLNRNRSLIGECLHECNLSFGKGRNL